VSNIITEFIDRIDAIDHDRAEALRESTADSILAMEHPQIGRPGEPTYDALTQVLDTFREVSTKRATDLGAMTTANPEWEDFIERLMGPEGIDVREGDAESGPTWKCGGGHDKAKATAILEGMGLSAEQIEASLTYFESNGGNCDCEIVLNVQKEDAPS
jgi:hypothetical protein